MNGVAKAVFDWLNAGLGLIYPQVCQLCGRARATPAEGCVCAGCRSEVRFIERPFCERCGLPFEGAITQAFECSNCRGMKWHFRSARSAVVARGQVLEVIHRYKYQRALWFEPFLAELLVGRASRELHREQWDWIVPVPLHAAKEREREFNQAQRLAHHLSTATRIPAHNRLLRRVLPTRTQTLLSRDERLANVNRAFALWPGGTLKGKRIVLIDDVLTTGATTDACARVLREAGAVEVCVWTVARGI
jgi:ComF family protein